MKIVAGYPPNWQEITQYLNPPPRAIFPFGEIIYNPSDQEIPPDVIYHETVHQEQQELFSSPELWWSRYLLDRKFRLEQEIEAYAKQLAWLKEKRMPARGLKDALAEFAEMLELYYNLGKSRYQLETLIRNYQI